MTSRKSKNQPGSTDVSSETDAVSEESPQLPKGKLVTTKEAADIIRCSPQHVRTLVSQGRLKAARTPSARNPFKYEILVFKKDAVRYSKTVPKKGWKRGVKRH